MRIALQIIIIAAVAQINLVPFALGATDKKIISGSICQPERPADRANLEYFARGLRAIGKDVELVCPIVRDSTLSKINFVEVRYQRDFLKFKPGSCDAKHPKDDHLPPNYKDTCLFHGEFWSCSNGEPGEADCKKKDGLSPIGAANDPTSVKIGTENLPHDEDNYYVYKTTLPKDTLLKSLTYQEETK